MSRPVRRGAGQGKEERREIVPPGRKMGINEIKRRQSRREEAEGEEEGGGVRRSEERRETRERRVVTGTVE